MTRMTIAALVVLLAAVGVSGRLSAQALKDEPQVREGIIAVGMAYEIAQQCPALEARLLRGIGYLQSLRGTARDLGYSEAEIAAYLEDRAEKDRLEALARARLADLGAVPGQAASFCAVGQAQIAADTAVGWLLR